MFRHHKNEKSAGFTLVELAIVLMIIGLLIGGVLRGQEMMENARIDKTVRQIQSYQAALVTFQEAYNQLPGDIRTPSARIPNCDISTDCGAGGDGNGLIGSYGYPGSSETIMTTGREENRTAWLHLANSHLISGINQDAPFSGGNVAYGIQFPSTPWGEGGFQMVSYTAPNGFNLSYGATGAQSQGQAGVHLFITNGPANMVTFSHGNMGDSFPLTPHEAAAIDRKMDDGIMYSGMVQSAGPNCLGSGGGWSRSSYNEPWTKRACAMVVKID